jgi:hypothetical protein
MLDMATHGDEFKGIIQSVIDVPVESYYVHPSEECIARLIRRHGPNVIYELVASKFDDYYITASLLTILGRMYEIPKTMRCSLVKLGLSSPNVEVRDATIAAVELWEDAELIDVLREHVESVGWLADYRDRIIEELKFTNG